MEIYSILQVIREIQVQIGLIDWIFLSRNFFLTVLELAISAELTDFHPVSASWMLGIKLNITTTQGY